MNAMLIIILLLLVNASIAKPQQLAMDEEHVAMMAHAIAMKVLPVQIV
jgi:hypothetical protein